MKVTQRTNLKFLIVLLIFCQVDFNAARSNSLRGTRRNSVNKTNKGKRVWSQTFSSNGDESTIRTDAKTEDSITEANNDEKKARNDGAVASRMWLELESVPPIQLSAKRNSDVTLQCVAVGSPPPFIYWLKNGKPIDSTFSNNLDDAINRIDGRGPSASEKLANFAMAKLTSKLPLRCLQNEDEAEYTCVADNDGRQLLASSKVSLEGEDGETETRPECDPKPSIFSYTKKGKRGQPAFVVASESLHMESIGSDIILPCRAAGRPRPFVAWIDSDGHRVTIGKKYQINGNGDLVIRSLSWNEMGEFTCIVENNYGSDSSATFLYPLLTEES